MIIANLLSTNEVENVLDDELRRKCIDRFKKEHPSPTDVCKSDDIIEYLDFGDAASVLMRNSSLLPPALKKDLSTYNSSFSGIVPIRNRVAHGRPLLANDFQYVQELITGLVRNGDHQWQACAETLRSLERDPRSLLHIKIPNYEAVVGEALHNLPQPDFDDTGFVGREGDLMELTKLLIGPNSVISLIGEGGIGKTALMLKAAYDILDLGTKNPFEAIIWVSSKTTVLTEAGIRKVHKAISDYTGVISAIGGFVSPSHISIEEAIKEIQEFIDKFKCLIIIDNLETIISENVRDFIRKAQENAKIAITSRVGLGELELRKTLCGMKKTEAAYLMRTLARLRNVDILSRASNTTLDYYVESLHCNPLGMRWFVQAVASGRQPAEVITNKIQLLNYCMDNVYSALDDKEKNVLLTILSCRRKVSEAEILFYSELDPLALRAALNGLIATSFVLRATVSSESIEECLYYVSPMAYEYLVKNNPPSQEFVENISKKTVELRYAQSKSKTVETHNRFSIYALEARNASERIVAPLLSKALQLSYKTRYHEALVEVEKARSIVPTYHEVYRVSAFIKALAGKVLDAEDDYRTALELEPSNARLLFFYGGFLLRYIHDIDEAVITFEKAYSLAPDESNVVIEYARSLGYAGKLDDAIALLERVRINCARMSMKIRRIAATLLMNMLRRKIEMCRVIEGDVACGVKFSLHAISVYEDAASSLDVDQRMVESLGDIFVEWEKLIDNADAEVVLQYRHCLQRYFDVLVKYGGGNIAYIRDFGDSAVCCAESAVAKGASRILGRVVKCNKKDGYIFLLDSEGNRLYGNRRSFKKSAEWACVDIGVTLEYETGENFQGVCAVNISFPDFSPKKLS